MQYIDKEEDKKELKNQNEQKLLGSGGIRNHASEETGALNQRKLKNGGTVSNVRFIGPATRCQLKLHF
jgi:hypothetical protein